MELAFLSYAPILLDSELYEVLLEQSPLLVWVDISVRL